MNEAFYYSFKAGHGGHSGHGGHHGGHDGKGKGNKGKKHHSKTKIDPGYYHTENIVNEHNKKIQAQEQGRLSHLQRINNRGALDAKKARDVKKDMLNRHSIQDQKDISARTSDFAYAYNTNLND
jgi:hypothetical protein